MKKFRIISLILVLHLLFMAVPRAQAADSSVQSGCHGVDASKSLLPGDQLLETSKAVLVYERNSDTLVYGYNTDHRIYPASMVKLMTALVALEKGNLSDVVTVRRSALNHVAIGSVSAGLKSGEEITLEALLYCMVSASANDAAVVIADHISGSQQAFVDLMNQKAAELGCTGTNFTNAHGLHDENCYTTVRDVCRILDAALESEIFRAMFCSESYTVPATNKCEERTVITSNDMMTKLNTSRYYDARVTGGKTGATDEAGRCLAITADHNGMELIAIVMGAEPTYEVDDIVLKTFGSYEEMAVLLDHTFDTLEYRQITFADQAVRQFPVSNGANNVVVAPVRTISMVLPVELDESQLAWVYGSGSAPLQAPIEKGQVISTLEVWYGDICVAQTELVAMNAVAVYEEPVNATRPVEQNGGNTAGTVLLVTGIVLGVGVLALAGYAGVQAIRRAIIRKRRLRRRREQRRRGNA